MGQTTAISWTDATWNVARGCSKVDDDCRFCYMYRDSLDNTRYDPKTVTKTKTVFDSPLKWKEPKKVFTSSLTDFFHEDIDAFRWECFLIMMRCPHHTFQVLTKRPERIMYALKLGHKQACEEGSNNGEMLNLAVWLEKWINGEPPKNVWLGTSIGSEASMIRAEFLLTIPAHIRFLSLEPLHGEIKHMSLYNVLKPWETTIYGFDRMEPQIHWLIVGGESGNENGKYRYRPCNLTWIQVIAITAQMAGVAVFVKQLGTHLAKELRLKDRHGTDPAEWPADLQIQEFPV